jgi:hypothetical protein
MECSDMPQVAQGNPSVTIDTPTPNIPRAGEKPRLDLTDIVRSALTVIGAIVSSGFLAGKLSAFDLALFLSRMDLSIVGSIVGGVLGLYVSFHLYLSKRHP